MVTKKPKVVVDEDSEIRCTCLSPLAKQCPHIKIIPPKQRRRKTIYVCRWIREY